MLSGLISTVRKLISVSYIDDNMFYCSPNNLSFQLVTGMTRIHSTLHVFSKIILVTPFWPLVLVRKASFFPFQNFPIFIIKICRSSCVHWTKVCLIKVFLTIIFFLFFSGSPKLKARQYYPCLFLNINLRLKRSHNSRTRRSKKGNREFYLCVRV